MQRDIKKFSIKLEIWALGSQDTEILIPFIDCILHRHTHIKYLQI